MTSQRHNTRYDTAVEPRPIPPPILDATREAVLAVGVRRTTLTDVARRAGVSRMTVYRLVPDVNTLILGVMTRDLGAVFDAAERNSRRRRTARSRLVAVVVDICRRLPREPLFRRVLDVDPELLLPYLTTRWGATQQLALRYVCAMVRDGHADGSIRAGDPETVSRMLIMLATPYVVSAAAMGERDPFPELERLVDRWLRP